MTENEAIIKARWFKVYFACLVGILGERKHLCTNVPEVQFHVSKYRMNSDRAKNAAVLLKMRNWRPGPANKTLRQLLSQVLPIMSVGRCI